MSILFSVIIPSYNAASSIIRAISSIIDAHYTFSYEIIVIDDGSNDRTEQLVKEYIEFNEINNIKFYKKANGGVSSARNYGLKKAVGEYIVFLDADDYLSPLHLYNYKRIIDINNVDMINQSLQDSRVKPLNRFGIVNDENYFQSILEIEITDQIGYLHNKCFKRKVIDDNEIKFPEDISLSEDLIFILKFIVHSSCYYLDNKSSYIYEDNDNSLSKRIISYDELTRRYNYFNGLYSSILDRNKDKDKDIENLKTSVNKRLCTTLINIFTEGVSEGKRGEDVYKVYTRIKSLLKNRGIIKLMNRNEKIKVGILKLPFNCAKIIFKFYLLLARKKNP